MDSTFELLSHSYLQGSRNSHWVSVDARRDSLSKCFVYVIAEETNSRTESGSINSTQILFRDNTETIAECVVTWFLSNLSVVAAVMSNTTDIHRILQVFALTAIEELWYELLESVGSTSEIRRRNRIIQSGQSDTSVPNTNGLLAENIERERRKREENGSPE